VYECYKKMVEGSLQQEETRNDARVHLEAQKHL